MKKFWMVYVEGERVQNYEHPRKYEAKEEAARLCDLTGTRVYVLEAIESCTVVPIPPVASKTWEILEEVLQGGSHADADAYNAHPRQSPST